MKEMVGGCCVCSDDRGWPENPLVYCDGQSCTVAVHQACYGIVTVPTGPWYCRKCESQERTVKVKCELCPSKYGALKRTDNSGWAHVVCALYIPEVRFGNVTTMEPIQLQLIPQERFSKLCYICEEHKKPANATVGACMQCNKFGCKQQFHVTCAQSLGLLCEEAGNYFDNVKYCGYCQHHYSKLKKGGNVKTIPPYKPVSTENHQSDSSSEKEIDPSLKSNKRKTSVSNKTVSKVSSNSKSGTTYQKTSAGASKSVDKVSKSNSSVKSAKITEDSVSAESEKLEKKDTDLDKDNKESIKGKKRKVNSRTPTPNIVSEPVPVAPAPPPPPLPPPEVPTLIVNTTVKKESPPHTTSIDKTKKVKVEPPQPPQTANITPATVTPSTSSVISGPTSAPEPPITTQTPTDTAVQSTVTSVNSVVVSVPLQHTSLSPRSNSNPLTVSQSPSTSAATIAAAATVPTEDKPSLSLLNTNTIEDKTMITSELSGGGLKITFEKQTVSSIPMDIDETAQSNDIPIKRTRSESAEKHEKPGRAKKKGSNGVLNSVSHLASGTNKRNSRSQHNTPPPQLATSSFSGITAQTQIKDSPPSSPSSESLGAPPTLGRKKGRKSAPASVASTSSMSMSMTSKESKENIKLFQNGVNAPHMLGNQLNLSSNMAQKMSDHLNSELEAHSIFHSNENSNSLVGPQLHHRVIASARSNSAGGSSTASGASGLSSMLGGGGGAIPQTLDQLLERQWEQGSQFLMEQAQHFDIASLLSCLHQLRAENLRLEEHVNSLLQRRDHLLAVNARLAIPLNGAPVAPQSSHPHTVNNIHPAVAASHAEATRPRHSSGYPPHIQSVPPGTPIENGISPEQAYSHSHRSPVVSQPQPSPNIRQSVCGFPSSGMMRQTPEAPSRSSIRPHNYSIYQSSSNVPPQMIVRRDGDPPHPNPAKPS